jgi:hypothetical protein
MLEHLVLLAAAIQSAILLGERAVSEHVLRGACRAQEWEKQRRGMRCRRAVYSMQVVPTKSA